MKTSTDDNMDAQLQQITHANSQEKEFTVIVPWDNTQTKSYAKDRPWTLHLTNGNPDQRTTIANGRKFMTFVEYYTDPRGQQNCTVEYAMYKAKFPHASNKWLEGTYLLFADLDDAVHLFRTDAFRTFALTYTIHGKQQLARRKNQEEQEQLPQVAQAARIAQEQLSNSPKSPRHTTIRKVRTRSTPPARLLFDQQITTEAHTNPVAERHHTVETNIFCNTWKICHHNK